jgi:hypothetical protein
MNAEIEEELRSHIQHRAVDLERSGLDRAAAEPACASSSAACDGEFQGGGYRRRPCSFTDTVR